MTNILAILRTIHLMALASTDGKVGLIFMAVLSTEQEKVKAYGFPTYFRKALTFTKVLTKIIKRTVTECINGQMERSMMDILRTI